MVSMIIKRDGRIVPYDETRVRMAVELAITDNNTNNMNKDDVVNIIANNVTTWLSSAQETEMDVETVQNYIVQNMKDLKLPKLAKTFTSYRNKRTRIREKKSSLMKSIGEMNSATALSSNSKRENANIDGDTAMGTMLKFGTTTSKEYYLNNVIPEKMSNAHREGWIHIHDLDFYSLTTTCMTSDTNIVLQKDDVELNTTFEYFDQYFDNDEAGLVNKQLIQMRNNPVYIKSGTAFTPIKWCSRRRVLDEEIVYEITTSSTTLKMTENHIVPICSRGGHSLVVAKNLKVGDILYASNSEELYPIISIKKISEYKGFVYDIETDTHFFNANDILVHNCTQIPIGNLLDRGFSTGHGHLRTPNSIGTAAALACIAIQSNQNDQHGGQSIPTFDYGLAPYVSKSFINNILKYLDMNEVITEDIQVIKKKLSDYCKKHHTVMGENNLKDIESIIYDVIKDDYVIPGMCIRSAIKYTDRDTYQAMEALIHNLNTMNCMHKTQQICVYKPVRSFKEFENLSEPEKQALGNLLRHLYNDELFTIMDISEQLNIRRDFLSSLFEYYGISKRNRKENNVAVENRLIRKYGVSNMMKLPENVEKVRKTQFENNGGKYAFNTDKQRQTCLERYGSTNPMTGSNSEQIKEKIRQTSMERYGVPCTLQNEEVIEKTKQTCLKKYGDVYVMGKNSSLRKELGPYDLSTPEGQAKAKEAQRIKYNGHWGFGDPETLAKIQATCKERYGYENPALPCMHGIAKSEDIVIDFLKQEFPDLEILRNKRSLIPSNKRLEVDIYIPEYKFAIEINGTYSHDKDKYLDDVMNDTCTTKEMKKCELLHKQGIKLIHIWEDDLYENIPLKLNRILYRLFKWICIDSNVKEDEE